MHVVSPGSVSESVEAKRKNACRCQRLTQVLTDSGGVLLISESVFSGKFGSVF